MSDHSQGEAHHADEVSSAPAGTGVTTLVANFEQKSTFDDPIPAHGLATVSESQLSVSRADKSSSKSKAEAFKATWTARYVRPSTAHQLDKGTARITEAIESDARPSKSTAGDQEAPDAQLAGEVGHGKALEVNIGTDATSLKSSSNKKRPYGESVHGNAEAAEPSTDVNNSSKSHGQVPTSPDSSIAQSPERPGTLVDDPPILQPASACTSQVLSDAIAGADQDSLSVASHPISNKRLKTSNDSMGLTNSASDSIEITAAVGSDDTESLDLSDEDAVDGFSNPLKEAIGIPESSVDEDDDEMKNWYVLNEDAIKRDNSRVFSVYKALDVRQALRGQTTAHKNVYQLARGRLWIGTHFYLILDRTHPKNGGVRALRMLTEGGKALANLRIRHAATHVIIVEPGRKLKKWLTKNFTILFMSGMGRTAAVCDVDEEETIHFGERVWRLEMKEDSCHELNERVSRRSGERVKGLTHAVVGRRLPPNQPIPDKVDKQRKDVIDLQIDPPPERKVVQQTAVGPGPNDSHNRPLQSRKQHIPEQRQQECRKGGNSRQADNRDDHNAGNRIDQGDSGGYRGGQTILTVRGKAVSSSALMDQATHAEILS
ncbi:hypothetical protein LTR95_001200 [Oleoguttula sp. CCFEE 5521]